jgi:hypothetical protein
VKSVIDRDFVVATVVPPTKVEVAPEAAAAVTAAPAKAAPKKG